MHIGCVMDPVERLSPKKDTTFAWILAAQARGHSVAYIRPEDLVAEGNRALCWSAPVTVRRPTPEDSSHATVGNRTYGPLSAFDVVWMRRDPPFDADYLYSTYILELAEEAGDCWVLNRPSGLRNANEKAYALHFPDAIPKTLVTHRKARIKEFLEELGGKCIVKPLDGHGGAGIFMLRSDDLNVNSILEVITAEETRYIMAQQYLPEARQGDKRVIMIDGEPLGGILRVPASGELRGNIHVGGRVVKAELTERDRELAAMVAPRLRQDGLYFVGLDIIGDYVTEINVTSPTGIQEMSRLDGQPYSERWIAWIEDQLARR
ncbi:MAG: glutathione synthase [Myxococcota bacterium]